jgi:hypothetical protein
MDDKKSGQGGQGPQQYLAFVALITLVSYFHRDSFIFPVMDGQAWPAAIFRLHYRDNSGFYFQS